ncbi:MAG: adenylate/guanylate cyclase domain-containing protein [Aeromicrobium sp.]
MDPVPTHYIDRDGAALAYQVVGDGPVDIVHFWEMSQHLDLMWTDPDIHHLYERAAKFSRSVYFQRRGVGLSDRISYVPTIEQQADDVLAVMDAVGMRRATLFGLLGTSGAVAMVAAKAPERVSGLVLATTFAQGAGASGELHGWTEAERIALIEGYRLAMAQWGSGSSVDMYDSVLGTAHNRRLAALLERCSLTPAAAQMYWEWVQEVDIQDVLRSVQVPTRVLHIPSSPLPEAVVRYVAELVPHGSFHALPETQAGASMGQAFLPITDHIEEVATGAHHEANADRFLGTVLFTDVVASTELLADVGDEQYSGLRRTHERLVRLAVENSGGELVTVMGDGTLSVFDGPSAAVRCAETICREAAEAGIQVRAGVHTGELVREARNVTGMSVHIGARVGATAGPGEVLVSRTVHDLVVGSGLMFVSRGEHDLKGVPGSWELFAVTHAGDQEDSLPAEESMQTSMDKMALQTARRAPSFARATMRIANAVERRRAARA